MGRLRGVARLWPTVRVSLEEGERFYMFDWLYRLCRIYSFDRFYRIYGSFRLCMFSWFNRFNMVYIYFMFCNVVYVSGLMGLFTLPFFYVG